MVSVDWLVDWFDFVCRFLLSKKKKCRCILGCFPDCSRVLSVLNVFFFFNAFRGGNSFWLDVDIEIYDGRGCFLPMVLL